MSRDFKGKKNMLVFVNKVDGMFQIEWKILPEAIISLLGCTDENVLKIKRGDA